MRPLASLVDSACFPTGTPLAVARCTASGVIEDIVAGSWPDGRAVERSDRFYGASLAKQLTGAAAAMLVRDGRFDPDQPVRRYLGELPEWAATITARQLAHHLAGLPAAGELEAVAPGDWTDDFVLGALAALPGLSAPPGTGYAYSNIGYILLARIVERVSGQPFAAFVDSQLLAPLGVEGMGFASDIAAFPQRAVMGPRLPLTLGDGGLWSCGRSFALWLHLQNEDALGIAGIVETPGRLVDGSEVRYGWGLGLRTHRDHRLLIHGGEWTATVAKAVRCPALGIAVIAMAADCPFQTLDYLVQMALNDAA
ncbi:Beta-lactamase [Devosia sp. LC5]|uniref:serine hydrolase domain-containing protein n=1 Tax=Devosia sp. LC5 TaxID=1502724 RepID=UPI0004E3A27A|nr:serine hydrolase domain-containing protein [Devosia sp. LC5]KFC68709.1 Beta-lactamase [Devosia sp. LC5]